MLDFKENFKKQNNKITLYVQYKNTHVINTYISN